MFLLKQEEETWRQKSRINWLASGDRNTNFFHAYENSRKQLNAIWDITKEDITTISNITQLQKEVVDFFQNMFKAQGNLVMTDHLAIINNYPRMFYEEEGNSLGEPDTLAEVLTTLKGFKCSEFGSISSP